METLTRELIETHLMSFIEIKSEVQRDGVTRWAWVLSPMAGEPHSRQLEENEFEFKYQSHDTARDYAFGWIKRHRPKLLEAAVDEAKAGIKYRAYHAQ